MPARSPAARETELMIAIGFHDVVPDGGLARPIAPGHTTRYTLERREFRNHLEAIRWRVGRQAVRRVDELGAVAGRVSVLLTFDDGALSAYSCVAQELESLGWAGHFFVTSNWIGLPGFLDRHQIRELHERGHLIGSHSCSHPERMSHLKWGDLVREWSVSCAALGEIIGRPVTVASVPGGYYSRRVAWAAAAAGIEVLFTSEPTATPSWADGCLVLGRYPVQGQMSASLSGAIAAGAKGPRLRQAALWLAKKAVKRITGRSYLSVRRMLLGWVPGP